MTPRTPTKPRQKRARRLNQAQKREANRQRILRAARTVFGARGFHGATIEQIAEEAGLSNGAIYYNFASKGELFLELLAERQDERIRHMRRTFAGGPQSGDRDVALEQEARDATRSLKQSREWRLLLFEFVAHAARTPDLAPKLREQERRFRAALGELLGERLDQRGVTPSIPKDQVAVATLAIANGLAFEEMSDPGAVPDGLLGELLALLVSS